MVRSSGIESHTLIGGSRDASDNVYFRQSVCPAFDASCTLIAMVAKVYRSVASVQSLS